MQKPSKIIFGIDPGTLLMGYCMLKVQGSNMELLKMDVLKLSSRLTHYERLKIIHQNVALLIEEFSPHELAVEAPFFGKNVQSMLKLGRAQGVAIAAAINAGVPVTEYSPRKIKQSITGNGNADKEQVWQMLARMVYIGERPKHFDATDALAVAICHHFQVFSSNGSTTKKLKGWDEFIRNNPDRIQ